MPVVAARLRIRNAADSGDLVTFGMAEMSEWPDGDGTTVNVITGAMRSGSYVVRIVDNLALTAVLNDGGGRGQLKSRRALVEVQTDGGAWVQRIGGYVTRVSIRDGHDAEIEVGESLRVPATALVPGETLGATINRGAIVGGPVITQWGTLLPLGGWRATVTVVVGRRVTMELTQTYFPPRNVRNGSLSTMIGDVTAAQAVLGEFTRSLAAVEYGGISPVNASILSIDGSPTEDQVLTANTSAVTSPCGVATGSSRGW
jgi:hypothetical protein